LLVFRFFDKITGIYPGYTPVTTGGYLHVIYVVIPHKLLKFTGIYHQKQRYLWQKKLIVSKL